MPPPAPLLAIGLANLPMLAWLAAAAVPVALHLWSRRRFREVPWAAMQYLLAALRKRRRWLLLQQYLLLAIRVLVIATVVLAVAEPYLEQSRWVPVPGQCTHHVLVVDGSYSMAYQPTEQSRFERAKQIAAQIVAQSPQGDAFTLVLMASPARIVVSRPAFEPGLFLHEIDQLPQTHSTADLRHTLALVQGLIESTRRDHPRLTRHEVCFLTDLGRVGWAVESFGSAAAEVKRRAADLAAVARMLVIDLGQAKTENAAITGLQASSSLATVAEPLQLTVELQNFGADRLTRREVELWIDGRRVQQQSVELDSGRKRTLRFACQFENAGDHAVEARLADDALPIDNHRWLALTVRQSVRVLCVDGRPDGAGEGTTYFLRRALAPRANDGAQPIQPEVVSESGLLERDLSLYSCVYLCDVAQFTPSEAAVLEDYLAGGGSLVFFLGDRVMPDRYNRQLTGQGGSPRILPASLGQVVEKHQGINPLDYRHPAVRAFRGQEDSGLLTTPIRKYFRLAVTGSSRAQLVLGLADGDPLVVEEAVGGGRVALVATAADPSWSDWPRWPSFLPFVHELLTYSLCGQQGQRNLQVGQLLEGVLSPPAVETPLRITRPDGARETIRAGSDGQTRWTYAETSLSGIYGVGAAAGESAGELFAVNLDAAESDLAKLSPEELGKQAWPHVAWEYETSWESPQQRWVRTSRATNPVPLWLLYAVLGLMLAETFVAWRMGESRP